MDPAFYILFRDGAPKDWSRAAEVLAGANAVSRAEATKGCRHGHGFIPIPLTEERARAGAAALSGGGIAAGVIAGDKIVELSAPFYSACGVPDQDGFNVQLPPQNKSSLLPWNSIGIVFVGFIQPTRKKTFLPKVLPDRKLMEDDGGPVNEPSMIDLGEMGKRAAILGLGAALGGIQGVYVAKKFMNDTASTGIDNVSLPPDVDVTPKDPEVCIELICERPQLRLRIRLRSFDYKYLGARRAPNTRGNFKLLLADLLKALPHALLMGHVKEGLSGVDLENKKFLRDESDLDLELSAIMTRKAIAT